MLYRTVDLRGFQVRDLEPQNVSPCHDFLRAHFQLYIIQIRTTANPCRDIREKPWKSGALYTSLS